MASTVIKRIFPLGFPWQTQDPFLFCVYHNDKFPKGNGQMGPSEGLGGRSLGQDFTIKDGWRMYHGREVPGFPAHPHRGFETITIVEEGVVDHTDSMGAAGRFGQGDVQWMTAGKGVQHSEMFPLINEDKGNPLELFQIWLNLPKASKFVEPHFKMLWHENIPVIQEKDANGKQTTIKIVAGKLNGEEAIAPAPDSWAATEGNQVAVWLVSMEAGASWSIPKTDAAVNRSLFMFEGNAISLSDQEVRNLHGVELKADEQATIQNGDTPARFLLLQGKPLNEPVVQHGPFVMNSHQEIQEAMREYGRTQFGGWPWPRHEYTHEKGRGRFALHADGRLEEKTLST